MTNTHRSTKTGHQATMDFSLAPKQKYLENYLQALKKGEKADFSRIFNETKPTMPVEVRFRSHTKKIIGKFILTDEQRDRLPKVCTTFHEGKVRIHPDFLRLMPASTRKMCQQMLEDLCATAFQTIYDSDGHYQADFHQYMTQHNGADCFNAIEQADNAAGRLTESAAMSLATALTANAAPAPLPRNAQPNEEESKAFDEKCNASTAYARLIDSATRDVIRPYAQYQLQKIAAAKNKAAPTTAINELTSACKALQKSYAADIIELKNRQRSLILVKLANQKKREDALLKKHLEVGDDVSTIALAAADKKHDDQLKELNEKLSNPSPFALANDAKVLTKKSKRVALAAEQILLVEQLIDTLKSKDQQTALNNFADLLNTPTTRKILGKRESSAFVKFLQKVADVFLNLISCGYYSRQRSAKSLRERGTPNYRLSDYGLFKQKTRRVLVNAEKAAAAAKPSTAA